MIIDYLSIVHWSHYKQWTNSNVLVKNVIGKYMLLQLNLWISLHLTLISHYFLDAKLIPTTWDIHNVSPIDLLKHYLKYKEIDKANREIKNKLKTALVLKFCVW